MVARLLRDGDVIAETTLAFAGERSTYAGELPLSTAGPVELMVLAMDPANANFGWARQEFVVAP
ncbi:MAG: hypothetical protein IH789_04695 [Acidobacteria bacterium]|nr:hypothetical protein [Acidobacteriota bacterium]